MDLLYRLAWRNIWRSPRRTILTVLAIAFATTVLMFFMGIQLKSYETGINATTSLYHGHIQIQSLGYLDKPQMRKVLKNRDAIVRAIGLDSNVSAYASRAFAFVLVSSGERTYGAQVMGVDPEREPTVSTLSQFVHNGEYLSSTDSLSVVIGKVLARNLKVDVGSDITILGQGYDGSLASTVLHVKGIFESGSSDLDRGALQMPLKEFDETFAMNGAVHSYVLRLTNFEKLIPSQLILQSELQAEGLSGISVLRWDELLPGLKQSMQLDMSAGWLFFSALIIIVSFSVLNTFLMSILERTKEFGVVLALGMSPQELRNLIVIEAVILGALGVIAGVIGGSFVVTALHSYGFTIPNTEEVRKMWNLPGTIYPDLTLVVLTVGPTVLFIASVLSGIYPAFRTKKIKILNALKGV